MASDRPLSKDAVDGGIFKRKEPPQALTLALSVLIIAHASRATTRQRPLLYRLLSRLFLLLSRGHEHRGEQRENKTDRDLHRAPDLHIPTAAQAAAAAAHGGGIRRSHSHTHVRIEVDVAGQEAVTRQPGGDAGREGADREDEDRHADAGPPARHAGPAPRAAPAVPAERAGRARGCLSGWYLIPYYLLLPPTYSPTRGQDLFGLFAYLQVYVHTCLPTHHPSLILCMGFI